VRYQIKAVAMDAHSRTTESEMTEIIDTDKVNAYAGCRKESPANCLLVERIYEALANQYINTRVVKVIDIRRID
jgi:hypothetical protein